MGGVGCVQEVVAKVNESMREIETIRGEVSSNNHKLFL